MTCSNPSPDPDPNPNPGPGPNPDPNPSQVPDIDLLVHLPVFFDGLFHMLADPNKEIRQQTFSVPRHRPSHHLGSATAQRPGLSGAVVCPGSWLRHALGTRRRAAQGPETRLYCGRAARPESPIPLPFESSLSKFLRLTTKY